MKIGFFLFGRVFFFIAITLFFAASGFANQRSTDFGDKSSFIQKGFSYLKWGADFALYSDEELLALKDTGATHVSIVPIWYQQETNSTHIAPHIILSPTKEQLEMAIINARKHGLKIMLKPHVDVFTDPWPEEAQRGAASWAQRFANYQEEYPILRAAADIPGYKNFFRRLFPQWRGSIAPSFWDWDTDGWLDRWFATYKDFIFFHAELAKKYNVEFFCIGTEFEKLQGLGQRWSTLIYQLRNYLSDTDVKLLYDSNHSSYRDVPFWGDLDYIGISAYFPISNGYYHSIADLEQGWRKHLGPMESWLKREHPGKKIIFSEAGFASVTGSTKEPWDFLQNAPFSEQEQADAVRATLLELPKYSWLAGAYFWRWTLYEGKSVYDYDAFSYSNKKAEGVFREYWKESETE